MFVNNLILFNVEALEAVTISIGNFSKFIKI